jgi:hypothetical protein
MLKHKRKSTKYVFILKNINTEVIDQKYGLSGISNLITNEDESQQPLNTTNILELNENHQNEIKEVISFLDDSKRTYQCNISMIDFLSGFDTEKLRYRCYWCRNTYNTSSIGCPIRYISSKAIKSYHSEVSKDNYIIKEQITRNKRKYIENNNKYVKTDTVIDKKEYFETDGVFCSFNCCKAFIEDNKHNNLYINSNILLVKMYNDMFGKNINYITPAAHWRLLKEYGGYMTITEFRENFNKASYEYHGITKKELFKPLAMLFEEKIKF